MKGGRRGIGRKNKKEREGEGRKGKKKREGRGRTIPFRLTHSKGRMEGGGTDMEGDWKEREEEGNVSGGREEEQHGQGEGRGGQKEKK